MSGYCPGLWSAIDVWTDYRDYRRIVVGGLSGSALSVSGPAAGLAVIVLDSITSMGSFEAFLAAVVLAGVFQVVLGYLKAGIIGLYFPVSVIKGMLAAIGIILILKQIPHFLGMDMDAFGEMSFTEQMAGIRLKS